MHPALGIDHTATWIHVHARRAHMVTAPAQLAVQLIARGTRVAERKIEPNRVRTIEIQIPQRHSQPKPPNALAPSLARYDFKSSRKRASVQIIQAPIQPRSTHPELIAPVRKGNPAIGIWRLFNSDGEDGLESRAARA